MDKRVFLKFASVMLLVAYLVGFAWFGNKELRRYSEETQFVGVVVNLPSRFHEPMNFYEIEHLKETIVELGSGPGKFQGLDSVPALSDYLGDQVKGQGFELSPVIALLDERDLRAAQSHLVELSVRVKESHNKKQTRLVLLFFCSLIGCFVLACWVARCFGRTKIVEHVMDGRSIDVDETEPVSPLMAAIHNTTQIESINSGHDHVLEVKGDDLLSVTDPNYPLLEASISEMVSNSIVHGGRASSVREASGKPGTIKIFVGIERSNDAWTVTVADDGEGIQEMQAMQHVLAKKLVSEEALKGLEAGHGVKLILLDGFSDAMPNKGGPLRFDSLAGIREAVKAVGGTVSLRNRPSVFCEFKLKLPIDSVANEVVS